MDIQRPDFSFFLFFFRRGPGPPINWGALGPQIKWGPQGPYSEKKKIALKRELFFFREKGPRGPPINWGAPVPLFPKKNSRFSANFFFQSGALGPPKNQGPRAPRKIWGPGPHYYSGSPGGLCPPGKILNINLYLFL